MSVYSYVYMAANWGFLPKKCKRHGNLFGYQSKIYVVSKYFCANSRKTKLQVSVNLTSRSACCMSNPTICNMRLNCVFVIPRVWQFPWNFNHIGITLHYHTTYYHYILYIRFFIKNWSIESSTRLVKPFIKHQY